VGTHTRVGPLGWRISIRVVISKIRRGATGTGARYHAFGMPPYATAADAVAALRRN
jgi:hypothetical protein